MARRIEQISRKRKKRNFKKCILVNYEGKDNKTEELYFNNFQNRDKDYYIKVLCCNVTDPVKMIEALIKYVENQKIDKYDNYKVFCIFDTDVSIGKQPRIDQAIKLAEVNNIETIISAPCFEIWFREHFQYTRKSYYSNEELIKDLKRFIPQYEKNKNIYEFIKDKTNLAVLNCKQLEKEQIENGYRLNTVECNPYTSVYKIIEYLNSE